MRLKKKFIFFEYVSLNQNRNYFMEISLVEFSVEKKYENKEKS